MLLLLAFAGKNGREIGFPQCAGRREIRFRCADTGYSRVKGSTCLAGSRADSEFFKN